MCGVRVLPFREAATCFWQVPQRSFRARRRTVAVLQLSGNPSADPRWLASLFIPFRYLAATYNYLDTRLALIILNFFTPSVLVTHGFIDATQPEEAAYVDGQQPTREAGARKRRGKLWDRTSKSR